MVILKNIQRNDKIISCDYFPEGKELSGHVEIDVKTTDVIQLNKSGNDKDIDFYSSHVVWKLWDLLELNEIPNEITVIWY